MRSRGMIIKALASYTPPGHGGGWQHKLKEDCVQYLHLKASGKGHLSTQSQKDYLSRIYRIFETITGELKFGLEDPRNIKPKHIEAYVKHCVEQKHSARYLDNNLTVLRHYCTYIGKEGMVKSMTEYAPGMKRDYAAKVDRSPQASGVDFWALWDKVSEKSPQVAMQLLLVMAFGARRKEAVCFKPLLSDKGTYIELVSGTKNGKFRTALVDTDLKRQVLAALKNWVYKKTGNAKGHLGRPGDTLEQSLNHYTNTLKAVGMTKKDLGFTGHSFRQEFVNDELERRGLIPTIRGGSGRVETSKVDTQIATDLALLQVSEQLGHCRTSVMTAYSGPRRPQKGQPQVSPGIVPDRPSVLGTAQESGEATSATTGGEGSGNVAVAAGSKSEAEFAATSYATPDPASSPDPTPPACRTLGDSESENRPSPDGHSFKDFGNPWFDIDTV
jgi:integrase